MVGNAIYLLFCKHLSDGQGGEVITNLQGTRTSKDSAIRFAQKCVLDFIEDAEFKWNVMTERIR